MAATDPDREAEPDPGRHAWFPRAEFESRVAGLRAAMALDAAVDAVLITDPLNIAYFTGYVTPGYAIRSRPVAAVIPADGDVTIVTAKPHVPQARAVTWVDDFEPYVGFEAECVTAAEAAVNRTLAAGKRLGYEGGLEHRPSFSVEGYARLRSSCDRQDWVDVSAQIWSVRVRKSALEVDYLRAVGCATGIAYQAVRHELRAGMTEEDVQRIFATALAARGASVGYFAMHSGPAERYRSSGWPTTRVIEAGDLVWMDIGAVYRGYWSDFTRMYAVGRASAAQQRSYGLMYEANRSLVAQLRPGVTAEQIAEISSDWFATHGIHVANAARIGHGIGTNITEPPSVMAGEPTVLLENMALAIEPAVRMDDGYFVVEENLLVTDDGAQYLSEPAPSELPVV